MGPAGYGIEVSPPSRLRRLCIGRPLRSKGELTLPRASQPPGRGQIPTPACSRPSPFPSPEALVKALSHELGKLFGTRLWGDSLVPVGAGGLHEASLTSQEAEQTKGLDLGTASRGPESRAAKAPGSLSPPSAPGDQGPLSIAAPCNESPSERSPGDGDKAESDRGLTWEPHRQGLRPHLGPPQRALGLISSNPRARPAVFPCYLQISSRTKQGLNSHPGLAGGLRQKTTRHHMGASLQGSPRSREGVRP